MAQAMIIDGKASLKSDSATSAGFVRGLLIAKKGNNLAVIHCMFPESSGKITPADLQRYYADNKIYDGQSGLQLWEASKKSDLLLEIQDAQAYRLPNKMMFVYPTFEKPMDIQVGEPVPERGVMTFSGMPESEVDIITDMSDRVKTTAEKIGTSANAKDIDGRINDFLGKKFDRKFDKAGRILGVGALASGYGLLKILEGAAAVGDVVETTKKTVKGMCADKKAGRTEKESFFKRWKKQFVSDKEKGELIFQKTRYGIGESQDTSRNFIERMGRMIKGR